MQQHTCRVAEISYDVARQGMMSCIRSCHDRHFSGPLRFGAAQLRAAQHTVAYPDRQKSKRVMLMAEDGGSPAAAAAAAGTQ
jgi:hypothetical protein